MIVSSDTFRLLFTCGGDNDDDTPPRIEPPKPKAPAARRRSRAKDDDDDDDDLDYINDPKERRIRQLSKENAKRRTANNDLQAQLDEAQDQIDQLTNTVNNGVKLQKKYDTLLANHEKMIGTSKEQAIRTALGGDVNEDGTPRAWYDTSMVLSLLDRDGLAVDLTDGSVGGLSEQLAKLAEEKPFLVKAASGDQKDSAKQNPPPSGQAPQSSAGGTGGQNPQANEQELFAMFPALQTVVK